MPYPDQIVSIALLGEEPWSAQLINKSRQDLKFILSAHAFWQFRGQELVILTWRENKQWKSQDMKIMSIGISPEDSNQAVLVARAVSKPVSHARPQRQQVKRIALFTADEFHSLTQITQFDPSSLKLTSARELIPGQIGTLEITQDDGELKLMARVLRTSKKHGHQKAKQAVLVPVDLPWPSSI